MRAGAQDYLVKPVIPDELKQAVSLLISAAGESVIDARRAERAAIQEELAIRQTENIEQIGRAKKKYLYARVKAIRLGAEMAFLAAGGARGAFAREWIPVFLEELCGADYVCRCEWQLNTNARRPAKPRERFTNRKRR